MEQQARAGHRPVSIWLETSAEVTYQLERLLFDANCRVHALSASGDSLPIDGIARILNDAGVIVLLHGSSDSALRERVRQAVGAESFVAIEPPAEEETHSQTASRIHRLLEAGGFISRFS
jgi:hypothetical protein